MRKKDLKQQTNPPMLFRYVDQLRWSSYFDQIYEVLEVTRTSEAKSCLIIGSGDGLVDPLLRNLGINVTTFDIQEKASPDYCGNVADIKNVLPEGFQVDCILCCQVLEHLDYEYFEDVLEQFKSIALSTVILSLPDRRHVISADIKLPLLKRIKFAFRIPRFYVNFSRKFVRGHRWEIGYRDYPLSRINQSIKKHFIISKSYNVFVFPSCRFFILNHY